MVKIKDGQRRVFDDAFRREAVRILAASDRTIRQVAEDLGVGVSSLGKWKHQIEEAALLAGPHDDVYKELARLRRENELLRAERDLLKNDRGTGPPVGIETGLPYAGGGGERPIAFWWRKTPLKNMVHGP